MRAYPPESTIRIWTLTVPCATMPGEALQHGCSMVSPGLRIRDQKIANRGVLSETGMIIMSESASNPAPHDDRGALGETPAESAERSEFSHASPGYQMAPVRSQSVQRSDRRSVRARKRRIQSKGEG
jgi:hypothetical protein